MDVFGLREAIVGEYARFTRSFTKARASDIRGFLDSEYERGRFWPPPLIQLNPSFVPGAAVEELVREGVLHEECARIFRIGKDRDGAGRDLRLHRHQEDAIRIAQAGRSYVLTTGTGSGKSLGYFIPIVDRALRRGRGEPRIAAIVVYPMNALCNSQLEELRKFLEAGYPEGGAPVTFARYTGQEKQAERDAIAARPPDILLTNYMMLELILTRQNETDRAVMRAARGLDFLVLDELHTYRGRQGADVALLVRRVREACNRDLLAVGTSATMASEGPADNRSRVVAEVATRMFGASVRAEDVVTETLARVTPEHVEPNAAALAATVDDGVPRTGSFDELRRHPLAAWIETRLGLEREEAKWLRTRTPRSLADAAKLLEETTGRPANACAAVLKEFLLLAHDTRDGEGRSLFAFRLHQFVTGGGDLFGTPEPEGRRYLTLNGQQYQPGAGRAKRLFTYCFCRECGQEYLPVWASEDGGDIARFEPRDLDDRASDGAEALYGLFMPDPDGRYRLTPLEEAFPEEWLTYDRGEPRLRPHYRKQQPRPVPIDPMGARAEDGLPGWFVPRSLRFCLNPDCRIAHGPEVRSELTKLSGLGTEGRSSATTVLTLAALRHLLADAAGLSDRARKILGFTDNRQDAALQAGHFNDFVQILMLRGALLAAIEADPDRSLTDDRLTQRVFEHLHLDLADFASGPHVKGAAAENTRQALRDVLGYRLYVDLRRGWRLTNPNLEQLGLLRINYLSLDEACADPELWSDGPDPLAVTTPEVRRNVATLVLDTMRRQLCVKARYLDRFEQERFHTRAFNLLREPWGFSEDEHADQLAKAAVFAPLARPSNRKREADVAFASYRSRLGRELARPQTWGGAESGCFPGKMTAELYRALVEHLLATLERYGIVERREVEGLEAGWQVNGEALRWTEGDPESQRDSGDRTTTNPFFRELYRNVARGLNAGERFLHRLEAREHTAQVDGDERERREERFRAAELPVLFCSPTMELGVDIAELNTVYMRNLPPTPANYAQRSGRAGRSGQPALVLTYAAAKSPHDQYFFRHPVRMVAGIVSPPTLDVANEDLLSSHLHAVWLAETRQRLPDSVADVLDRERADEMPLRADLAAAMNIQTARDRALARGRGILAMLEGELTPEAAPWYAPDWLDRTIATSYRDFESAFERWRTLYKATSQQMRRAQEVMNSAAASPNERDEAKRRHDEAYQQQKLLLDVRSILNSDFYTYRYLASQGFLPGYNFPRLPLLAYVPARREKVARDGFLSRPRFLALAEFGPRSVIYHEGSQYRVTKAILGVRDEDSVSVEAKLPERACRLCPECGYGHFGEAAEAERCSACNALLEGGLRISNLYRIDNVATRRATRITSDEEERLRLGYETITTLQFARRNGTLEVIRTAVGDGQGALLELQYGPAATIWRVNLGWRRRKDKQIFGFNIDVLTGRWAKDAQAPSGDDGEDANGRKVVAQRITPYVEDRRNVLIVFPKDRLDHARMATLQHALKRGIEREFQLEESELVAEALPSAENRRALLFYEAAEGGAGVLTRLATDPSALRRVAAKALEVCHFQPAGARWVDGEPLDQDPDCEAGCYRCLLSYYNQPDHEHIDRRDPQVLRLLCRLTEAEARKGSEGRTFEERFEELRRLSGSSLEHAWLDHLRAHGYRLPDRAQPLIQEHGTRADFAYAHTQALVYIDGPHHRHDRQKQLDARITERLEDAGFTVIRFGQDRASWPAVFAAYPDVFGTGDSP